MDAEDIQGAIIFLHMVVGALAVDLDKFKTNESDSLAILSNATPQIAALVHNILPNDTLADRITATKFLQNIFKHLNKYVAHILP